VHSPSQSPSQPPGRVLRLIIVLPVSLLCSPRRHCVHHIAAAFSMSSFRSAHRLCLPIAVVILVGRRCWSCGHRWPSPGCTTHVQNSWAQVFDGCSAVGWGRGGPSSSLAHSCCSGITHRTLIVSVVLMRFAYRVDSPSLPSSILLSSSSITPGASSSNPPSLLKSFLLLLLLLYSHHHLLDSSLLLAVHSPCRRCRFPPSLSLCPHIGLLPHGSPPIFLRLRFVRRESTSPPTSLWKGKGRVRRRPRF